MNTHDRTCPMAGKPHSDAAKRIYDIYHLHRTADLYGTQGKWIACALNDGSSDGVVYDSKRDAVTHQHHNEEYYLYIQITPANMSLCDAEIYLGVNRRLSDAGFKMADPDDRTGGRDVIKRASVEDQLAYLRGKSQNIRVASQN